MQRPPPLPGTGPPPFPLSRPPSTQVQIVPSPYRHHIRRVYPLAAVPFRQVLRVELHQEAHRKRQPRQRSEELQVGIALPYNSWLGGLGECDSSRRVVRRLEAISTSANRQDSVVRGIIVCCQTFCDINNCFETVGHVISNLKRAGRG